MFSLICLLVPLFYLLLMVKKVIYRYLFPADVGSGDAETTSQTAGGVAGTNGISDALHVSHCFLL